VLNHLEGVEIVESNEVNWNILSKVDLVFMQRPSNATHLAMLQMVKDNDVAVWLDYDDDVYNVPMDNPSYGHYSKAKPILAKCLALADAVTVSTEPIKTSFGLDKAVVIPNAFNDYRWNIDAPVKPRKKLIYWRGSNTHTKDLSTYTEDIIQIALLNPDWHWLFLGPYPWMLEGKIKNIIHQDNMDLIKYMKLIKEVGPAINIVPLHDSPFNRAKSNIASLEATYAGALTLGPAWEGWKLNAGNYTPKTFKQELQKLIRLTDKEHQAKLEVARTLMEANYSLKEINKTRMDIINVLKRR
jgi:hypothetical protein